jgi:hypothetical protein
MRRFLAVFIAIALLSAAASPALAGHYRYGHSRHHHRHGGGHGYAVAGVVVGGLLLASILSRPSYPAYSRPYYPAYSRPSYRPYYRPYYRPAPAYAPPPPPPVNCQQTTGTGSWNGRPALFGGTWCSDQYGQGYVVNGSTRFLGYLE